MRKIELLFLLLLVCLSSNAANKDSLIIRFFSWQMESPHNITCLNFEEEDIMYGEIYKKVPLDYTYYYAHKNGFTNPEDKMNDIIAEQKKGIKLLLIDTYR